MPQVCLPDLLSLAQRALERSGARAEMAQATAAALVDADASGLATHGVSRLPLYCTHLREGRVDGAARPVKANERSGCCLIDARGGLAYEALKLGSDEARERARTHGIADAGQIGLAFTNSPAAVNAWGGKRALFGTNPIAAIFPRRSGAALLIDLSITEVVRGKIMLHAERGEPIPLGWALDRDGEPTTDARAALTGSLFPIGGAKGAMLALMVELICCALTGAAFGFENDSYFEPGGKPRIGHALIAIDPTALAGRETYLDRIDVMIDAMLADADVRLPGARRAALRERAQRDGVIVPEALFARITELAG